MWQVCTLKGLLGKMSRVMFGTPRDGNRVVSSSQDPPKGPVVIWDTETGAEVGREREFCIDNLLVQIHVIIVMIRWTGLAPWEFEFPFPGSLTSTFLVLFLLLLSAAPQRRPLPPLPSPRPRGRPPALRERPGSLRCTI